MKFIDFLTRDQLARKVFGKKEIEIIKKQVFGVNLKQSERNRLARDIRKKLEFISKASKFSEEFNLKKGDEIKKLIDDTKEEIFKDFLFNKIKKIILFGSHVKNEASLKSDIDIAILFENISKEEAGKFRKRVSGAVSDKIDIQVFNVLPKKIKTEILKEGEILYKNEKGR
jgi:predicted nucleotidyltransferase